MGRSDQGGPFGIGSVVSCSYRVMVVMQTVWWIREGSAEIVVPAPVAIGNSVRRIAFGIGDPGLIWCPPCPPF
jgi:hypothetical protein